MNKNLKMIILISLFFLGVLITFLWMIDQPPVNFVTEEGVVCKTGSYDRCGYHLRACDNGAKYYCATNVRIIEVNDNA